MDILMIVLRLIHIFAGTFWVGFAGFMLFFVTPTAQQLGPDGGKFMSGLLRLTRFPETMPAVAVLTLLSGLVMYYKVSDGFNSDWMGSSQGIVLSIGVVAGILAVGHGGSTIGQATSKLKALAQELAANQAPPTPEQAAEMQRLQTYMGVHTRIAFGLMVVAVIGMAAARYA
jgi:uncharacterized membrane protein